MFTIMGPGCVRVCLFLALISSVLTSDHGDYIRFQKGEERRRTTEIDVLLEELIGEKWQQEDVPCFQAFQEMLYGVKNSTLWATWMWDSMQRPTASLYGSRYHMGSFDQCLNPPWRRTHRHLRAKYCLVDMPLTDTKPIRWTENPDPYGSTDAYINTTSKYGRHLNMATLGVCLPTVCSGEATSTLALLMMRSSHLPEPRASPVLLSCQQGEDIHQYSAGFYLFICILALVLMAAILVTIFPEYVSSNSVGTVKENILFLTCTPESSEYEFEVSEIRLAFDVKRNWSKLLEVSPRELRSVHGIKSITAGIIICSHYLYYSNLTPIFNGLHIDRDLDRFVGMFILHADLTVDTFFAISGMLLMSGLMSGSRKNPLHGLVKRYIRIIGPLLVMVLYFSWVHEHVGSGPLWTYASGEQRDLCHKNWWATLFMVNNYVNDDQICHTVTWYLSCDFQLAMFGTLLHYLYQRNPKAGKIVISLTAIAALVIPSVITYNNKLSPLFFHDIQGLINFKTDDVFLKRYTKAHCRAAAYMVGMLLGSIFATYKPEMYRNKLSKGLSILGFVAAFSVLVAVYRAGGLIFYREYDALESAAFVAFNRVTWAIALCCLIAIFEYGTLPFVSAFLKWEFFVPFSRLSYCQYIIHMGVVYYSVHGARVGARFDFIYMVIHGLGIWVVVTYLSIVMWLTVEAPVSNLSNHIFSTRSTPHIEKTEKIEKIEKIEKTEVKGNGIYKIKSS